MAHAFLKAGSGVSVKQRCTKVAFPSRQEALKAAREFHKPGNLSEHGSGKMTAYRCGICGGGWHTGHLPLPPLRAQRKARAA